MIFLMFCENIYIAYFNRKNLFAAIIVLNYNKKSIQLRFLYDEVNETSVPFDVTNVCRQCEIFAKISK